MMNPIMAILPEITLFVGALVILMTDVFFGKKLGSYAPRASYILSIIFTISSLVMVYENYQASAGAFGDMFFNVRFTSFVKISLLAILIATIITAYDFIEQETRISSEFIALLMIATTGGMILTSSNDLLPFYLSLELMSLSLYLLAAIKRSSSKSSEAGMKYFILGSVASGILLLGISFIYGFSGTTNLTKLVTYYQANYGNISIGVMFGLVLIMVAMFFKISAAPFHMWAPDVYEGSTVSVTNYFASAVKFVSVMALLRIYTYIIPTWPDISQIMIFASILSLLIGCFGGLKQNNLKRMLAYSGIGHVGFVSAGMAIIDYSAIKASILYMVIYASISLGSFAFLVLMSNKNKDLTDDKKNGELYQLSSLAGLAKSNPISAFAMAILMLSMAGIPPMAGFFSKFYILMAAVNKGLYFLAVIAVLSSVISAFYYLRIIKIMYFDNKENEHIELQNNSNSKIILSLMAFLNLIFLVYMEPLLSIINGLF